jgi:hypothetical protein
MTANIFIPSVFGPALASRRDQRSGQAVFLVSRDGFGCDFVSGRCRTQNKAARISRASGIPMMRR